MQTIIKNIKEYYLEILSLTYILILTTRITRFWVVKTSYFDWDEVSGNVMFSVLGILCLLLLLFRHENLKWVFSLKYKKLIWCILIYALASTSWALLPYISFRRWLKIFILIVLTIYIQRDQKLFFKIILWYISIVTLSSLFLIIFLPKFGFTNYYGQLLPQGIMGHKNFLGLFSAISLIVLPFLYQKLKSSSNLIKILLLINLMFVLLSSSRTAQTALIIAYLLSGLIYTLLKNKLFLSFSLTIMIIAIIFINVLDLDLLKLFNEILYLMGKDPSFTGRTELWQALISLNTSYHLFLGFGFKSFFVGNASSWLSSYLPWEAATAHSDYITIFMELGLIGNTLMILFLLSSYTKNIIAMKKNNDFFFMVTLLNFYLIESITEVHFLNTTILFVFLIITKTYPYTIKSPVQ